MGRVNLVFKRLLLDRLNTRALSCCGVKSLIYMVGAAGIEPATPAV